MSYKILLILIKNCKNTWYDLNHGLGIPPKKKLNSRKQLFMYPCTNYITFCFDNAVRKLRQCPGMLISSLFE